MTRPDATPLPGVDPRFARSARRWLVAYPRDWREERADEVTSLLADLAAPGARRVGARAGLPLVWSGMAARRRRRPPLHVVLGYRSLSRPVPARYRAWVRADLTDPWRPLWAGWWRLLGVTPVLAMLVATADATHEVLGVLTFFLAFAATASACDAAYRRRDAERHLLPSAGERLQPGDARRAEVLRDRAQALPAAEAAVRALVVLALGSAGCLVVAAAGGGPGVGTAVTVAVGAALGPVALRRARRRAPLLDGLDPQPGRRLVLPTTGALAAAPLGAAAVVGLAATTVAAGDERAVVATVALAAAAAGAPVLLWVRGWLRSRRDLAGVDVLRALVAGRRPPLDLPRPGLVLVPPAAQGTDGGTLSEA
ncbi:hypothetical protein [Cellulomonas sp.]|uniref:hypothetical protein n=1 Tax=Cellulomonas sp. TaxID=40001 RepID=UPI002810B192|nr:hypothetical protein [Cellulomonas sp.]